MKKLLTFTFTSLVTFTGTALAATYDVGPGKPRTTLSAVPWAALQPGDFVNIHYKPGGYHEKIQVSASGTQASHIVIRGIPDPATGALPILDGQNAVDDPSMDLRGGLSTTWGIIMVSPRKSTYVYGAYHVSWVDIESLDIRNAYYTADNSISFTDQFGKVHGYDGFACGIYIEWAHDFAVRGCEISNCCNGLFANSKNLAAQSSQRLLIEKNYFHDNSLPYTADPNNPNLPISNGYHEHHLYTESAGCIIQYNRFGRLRPGAHGVAIKDRSSGQIIRYNEFDMTEESNVLALPNCQGGSGFINLQPDYQEAYVYGNLITIENYTSGITAVMWGAFDGPKFYADGHRGTLHFYNNTIVNHHAGLSLFLMPDVNYTSNASVTNPTYENVDFRNNIVFTDTSVQNNPYYAMRFVTGGTTNGRGDINLGKNWLSPAWRKEAPLGPWTGALNGVANLIVGDNTGANDPHFVDMAAHDYHVLIPGNSLDAAGALSASSPAVTLEYLASQNQKPRVTQGLGTDLGALESTGLATPPPPAGALQFSTAIYNVNEGAGLATITVTRVGGTTGAVSVSYSTPAGGSALDGSDYTSVVGTLTWPDGESTPKSFTIPILEDTEVELTETVNLTLFNPTGGAVLGTLANATLNIQDNDTPPSVLLYALTDTSNALMLIKSGPPCTPLSYTLPSGLVNGDSLRALAVQPSTGKLFAVGTAHVLYTVNPFTGVATAVGAAFAPAPTSDTMDLTFDRITGALHLFTASGQNLTLNPAAGQVLSSDAPLAFALGDVNQGIASQVVGVDSSFIGGVQTYYGFDAGRDAFVRIGSIGGVPQNAASGQIITIGTLGTDTGAHAGLKIPVGASYGFATLSMPVANGVSSSRLFAINLGKGNAVPLGTIRSSEYVRDIAIAPARDLWKLTRFGANAGNPAISGDDADPDHNGISNLIGYALGTPATPGAPAAAQPVTGQLGGCLTLTFTRPVSATDIIYTVQVSDDQVAWQNGSTYAASGDTPANAATTQVSRTVANGIETITVQDNTPLSSSPQRAIRLTIATQ